MISKQFFTNLEQFAKDNKFDAGHGMDHFMAVYHHAQKAIRAEDEELDKSVERMILLSCSLHDVDDSKFFGDPKKTNYANARKLLETETENLSALEVETIIHMISLVSCSTNGNNKPFGIPDWMLIPRFCDRLESSGIQGIERVIGYGNHVGRKMYDDKTERVKTLEELNKVASPQRFVNYLNKSLHSDTTIGHIYDKMIHITNPDTMGTTNTYILKEAEKRHQILVDYILNFWKEHE